MNFDYLLFFFFFIVFSYHIIRTLSGNFFNLLNNREILRNIITILEEDNYEYLLNSYLNTQFPQPTNETNFEESSEQDILEDNTDEIEEDTGEESNDESNEESNDELIEESSNFLLNIDTNDMTNIINNIRFPDTTVNTNSENLPLDIHVYNNLERFRIWSPLGSIDDDNNCSICLSKYKWLDSVIKMPCCKQNLHSSCLKEWFNSKSTCPLCRNNLNPDNINPLNIIHRVINITNYINQIINYRISHEI